MSNLLYQSIESAFEYVDKPDVPKSITDNIKQQLREYQVSALENFIFYMSSKKHKEIPHKHLLFHMATGSGKTNIIAASILYLYDLGYRDFIFFVNTNNIITKTKDNLVNKYASKYLFMEQIRIQNTEVEINVIEDTFDSAKSEAINILFTTINKLHGDLETTIKENSITYDDFSNRKLVLIADEAHHLNADTKSEKETEQNWEQTTRNLLNTNRDNILLEFTATQDLEDQKIGAKYKDKIIADYPLVKFREDRYSKDIKLISDNLDDKQRMLQAVMISEYRRLIAQKELNLSIKPVIMFKTVKNTDNIDTVFEEFVKIIDDLSVEKIDEIFKLSTVGALQALEKIVTDKKSFVQNIQYSFAKSNCLVIHSKVKDKEEKLKNLNSLEDIGNKIRAIFAVDILNEGWDVLNLFDIVKLDEMKKTAKSTISEAQLIGRGARYFPFVYNEDDKYKRKFDTDFQNPLKILEEMHFYSVNQSDYIASLTKELRKIGLIDDKEEDFKIVELKVKQSFLDDELYKNGVVYTNKKIPQDKSEVVGISDYLGKSYKTQKRYINNTTHELSVFEEEVKEVSFSKTKKFKLKDENPDLVRVAINKKPFFYFSSLRKYFVNLKSIREFIQSDDYLGGIEFDFYTVKELEITDEFKIQFILEVLGQIEDKIVRNAKDFVGSREFYPVRISSKIPPKKRLKLKESDSTIDIIEEWYVFESHGATSEEKHFTDFMLKVSDELKSKYKDVKLLRNEKAFEIYSFDKTRDGAKFEPDFVLLLKDKNCYHQIFCEPKGDWAKDEKEGFENSPEKWKNEFLADITKLTSQNGLVLHDRNENGLELYENSCYRLLGLPFYNYANENEFKEDFSILLL
ncbi:MAG: DEAD/DEAH box helicase family protein [Sulfuricurvum sp.]|jgi:type III restriction enzyme